MQFHRFFNRGHLIQHLFTAFCTLNGFFTVEGAKLFNDRFLMLNFLLLIQILFHSGFTEHFLFLGVICIIAHKSGKLAQFDLDDFCYNPVQKIPVMRDNQYCTGIIQKISFQP